MSIPEHIDTTDVRAADGTYTVMVNDMPLRTPKGHLVTLLSWDLANALADELMSHGEIDLQRVTLYSLYATQRDFIEARMEPTIGVILQHLPGDFVLHPDADPGLAAMQLAAWAPMLASWRDLGAEVPIARPLQAAQIPWELTQALQEQLSAMSPAQLTVVVQAMTNLGSVTLGMCLAQRAITVEQAVDALSATFSQAPRHQGDAEADQDPSVAEIRQTIRRLRQYVQLNP
jgi:chaperone required for assembly of F1-ATPase